MKTLWLAAFAAPLAWFVDLVSSFAATPPAYEHGSAGRLHVISFGSIAITVLCGVIAALYLRSAPRWECRQRFVARTALWISLLSLVLVLASAIPKWLLAPGAEP